MAGESYTRHYPRTLQVMVGRKIAYRAWCECRWSGGPDFVHQTDAFEEAEVHVDAANEAAKGADTLDTLQAVSELPSGSVVELKGGVFAKVYPADDCVYAEFFGRKTRSKISWLMDLPAKVIKRG